AERPPDRRGRHDPRRLLVPRPHRALGGGLPARGLRPRRGGGPRGGGGRGGSFLAEGFAPGVGSIHGWVGHDEAGRRAVIGTIGPFWDGNEVWLIVAAAGKVARCPGSGAETCHGV